MTAPAPSTATPDTVGRPRMFGRFELRKLLGKSAASMVWLAQDPTLGHEVMLTLPRVQPPDAAALLAWTQQVKLGARLNHPHLAAPLDIGVEAHWPYVSVDRRLGVTLPEWLAERAAALPVDSVGWLCQALEGLAFAHDAGCAHGDLQLHSLLIDEQGTVQVVALGAARSAAPAGREAGHHAATLASTPSLKEQRDAGSRDVLACGMLLHRLLTGQPVLGEADVARAVARMVPSGRDIVRLPWTTPYPITEGLRAIANRCTATQERQRYLNARTLLRALGGWRDAQAQDNGGPLALLLDRLGSVGHLPALPGVGARVSRLSRKEGQRTDEMAEQILQDMALSFELLRQVNSAHVQGTQVTGNGPVLTIRRCIALMGLDGVRHAASALRAWPGPLSEAAALALTRSMQRARWAGHVAQALRPAGYDAEVVYLVALLQNLGRLLVHYHFPQEAEQARQLMLPAPSPDPAAGVPELPGLSEEAASFAVLGVNSEDVGAAVARHWGLGDEVLHMIRRLPKNLPVRMPDGDDDRLRATASAANDAVDAASHLAGPRLAQALSALAQRYGRSLNVNLRDVQGALDKGRQALRRGGRVADAGGSADADDTPATDASAAPTAALVVGPVMNIAG